MALLLRASGPTAPEFADDAGVSVKDMAAHLGLAERTVRNRIERMNGEFILENGIIR